MFPGLFDKAAWKEKLLVSNDDSDYERTNWCNRDLIPMPKGESTLYGQMKLTDHVERRTYGMPSFFLWWFTGGL